MKPVVIDANIAVALLVSPPYSQTAEQALIT